MSNLDAILAAAKEKSTSLAPIDAGVALPAVTPMTGGAVAAYNMSEDAFLNPGGMECDSYVQVKDTGIKLSKDWKGVIDGFDAILDTRDVQFFMGIRKEVGSTVSYAKSYDGVSTPKGENFAQVVQEFKATSQKPADTYRGADIPMELVSNHDAPKGGGTSFTAGQVVGLTTSITGFKPFATFLRKLKQAGVNGRVKVSCKHSPRQNTNGQDYGVIEWDVVEILDQPEQAAA